eukprot:jgi/Mesvir1/15011/Mv14669-RA.1
MKLWIVAIVLIVLACVWLFSFVGSALAEPAAKFWCAVTLRGGNKECVENTKRKLQSALGDVRLWLGSRPWERPRRPPLRSARGSDRPHRPQMTGIARPRDRWRQSRVGGVLCFSLAFAGSVRQCMMFSHEFYYHDYYDQ